MKKTGLFIVLVVLLAGVSAVCLTIGSSSIPLKEVLRALLHPDVHNVVHTIIWGIRLPRILLALLVGAGLAASGCVFQGVLRNPLAEPFTLGISGGAAFGVTVGTVFGLRQYFGYYGIALLAFCGALLSVVLVYMVASRKYFSVPTLILAGVILSFVFSSVVLLIFSLARSTDVHNVLMWLMGDMSAAQYTILKPVALFVLAGIALLFYLSRDINLLSLGEEKATNLGLNTENIRRVLFIIASLITGACVSASGIIGFVGLLVPHFMRQITGPGHTMLIPASALAGAVFLITADTLARTITAPMELPVGVITGIFGGIFLLIYLLGRKKWELF